MDQTWSLVDQLNLTSFKTIHRILKQIKADHLKTNWIDSFQYHTLYNFKADQSESKWIKPDQTWSLVDQFNLTSFKTIHYMILKQIKTDQTWSLVDQFNLTSFKTIHKILKQITWRPIELIPFNTIHYMTLKQIKVDQSESKQIKPDHL